MLVVSFTLLSVNPQSGRFTNNSLSVPHAHSLSVCLFLSICDVCVCFLVYLSVSLYFSHCVLRVLFHNHLFHFQIYIYMSIDVHADLPHESISVPPACL